MKFGPNGDLYVLEYGDAGFRPARKPACKDYLCEGGNRPPVARIASDKSGGMPPLPIQLFSA